MAIAKICRNENHLMLLAVIDRTDRQGINADVQKLAELGKFFNSHVEYMLDNLLDEGLITIDDKEARPEGRPTETATTTVPQSNKSAETQTASHPWTPDTGLVIITLPKRNRQVAVHHFSLTPQGRKQLEERKRELGVLSIAMQRLYHAKNPDELYRAIFWNREWIAFMLYTGILTPNHLKAMLDFLGVEPYRISITEMQEAASDIGLGPDFLSLGVLLSDAIHAVLYFLTTHILMHRLEHRHANSPVVKSEKKKNNPDGDIYFPTMPD